MTLSLRLAASGDRALVERLVQLEQHDLSDVTGAVPGEDGLFEVTGLDRFFSQPGGAAYVIWSDDAPAGFALVRRVEDRPFVHAFFVVRSLRHRGVGGEAAVQLLATEPGPWTIAFVARYDAAARFWRAVATRVAGGAWTEEQRHRAGETFGWITLDTPT